MQLVIPLPSLTGGVSTQPPQLRLPTQAEESINTNATLVDGLKRRPPAEYLGKLLGFPTAASTFHAINAPTGDYFVAAGDEALKVWDLSSFGSSVTLRNKAGGIATAPDFGYLDTPNPQRDLRFLTLADYTLVLNRAKTVAADPATTTAAPNQALVTIVLGSYSRRYKVSVSHTDGSARSAQVTTYSSSGLAPGTTSPFDIVAAENSIKTDQIAANLVTLLTSTTAVTGGVVTGSPLGAAWTVSASGSHLLIKRNDGANFTVSIEESVGGTAMTLAYQEVQTFQDLPVKADVGMKIKVAGTAENSDNSVGYWVEFVAHNPGTVSGWADGYWRECAAPGISKGVNPLTMPHALLRQPNGEWRWTPLDGHSYTLAGLGTFTVPSWDPRTAGDLTTNVDPAFVGEPLLGMCFHEGRLGLLSQEALSLSEAREPFSFYRTTVANLIDSDRIEVRATSPRGELLSHAVPLGRDILLFGDGVQFLVRADGAFTPNTITVSAAGRYDCDTDTPPIQVGEAVVASSPRGLSAALQEFRTAGDQNPMLVAADLTSSVPGYLSPLTQLSHSPQITSVVARPASGTSLFVLNYFWSGSERVQNAWQTWTFPWIATLHHVWMFDTRAYMVATVGSEVHVFQLRLEIGASDPGGFSIHLDRRVAHSQCTVATVNKVTTFTLPFAAPAGIRVVQQNDNKELQVLNVAGNNVEVSGAVNGVPMWLGVPYETRHEFSEVKMSDQSQAPVASGELRLDRCVLFFSDSGPFEATVTTDLGATYTSVFAGPYLGQGANYQKMRVTSGKFSFGIRDRAANVSIAVACDGPWPMRLVSADFEARMDWRRGARA